MKFTCLFDCVCCFCCCFAVIIFFKRFTVDGCEIHLCTYNIISQKAADSRPSIRRREHFESKIRPLK